MRGSSFRFTALALVLLAACGSRRAGDGPVQVRGRLIDGETGQPVSRQGIWIHAFCDEVKSQVTLEGADESAFALRVPTRHVRLRVADDADVYALYEKKFDLDSDALDVEVRLTPTHWVRLHGRVLWRDGTRLRPVSEGDGDVRHARIAFQPAGRMHGGVEADEYWVRVPREKIRVMPVVNSNRSATPREIDLTGSTETERNVDIVLGE